MYSPVNGRYTLAATPEERMAIATVAAVHSYFQQHPQGVAPGQGFLAAYDRPDLVALVVSSDGPVTIFSDGVRASALTLRDHGLPWNPSGGEMWAENATCPTCGAGLTVRKIILYGYRESEEGYCPICRTQVASVHGWAVEVGLVKDTPTIERLVKFRRRSGAGD